MNHTRRTHIFVLIDALGWQYLESRDFLNDFLPYRMPLRTVLGFSSGAIPTILTGVPPAVNGHWNLFYYDPDGSPFRWMRHVRFFPEKLLDHRIARRLVTEVGRRFLGLGPLFECCVHPKLLPWFNWVEKRSIYSAGGITGARSIFDTLKAKQIPFRIYTYHRYSDAEVIDCAQRDVRARAASFYFLYLSEFDHFLHAHSSEDALVSQRLRWYEERLRELFAIARKLDPGLTFAILSDHGMTPVEKRCDVVKEIDTLGWRMPQDYLAVYDSTMARFWFFKERAREGIVQRLASLPCGRIVPDEELGRLGVFFPDRRYGEVIFLLHPRWLLSRSDFHGKGWMPNGMHGYHPDDPFSDAIFLSNRAPAREMKSIADVYPQLLEATQ